MIHKTYEQTWRPFAWLISLLFISPLHSAEPHNFTAPDIEFIRAAETAREYSARFWSGQCLPGDWYAPCPIVWPQTSGPGSGWTSFQFQRGEVFGRRMTLRGERTQVLADVIPHEVDHAVRATLCRRPLPRWLDEGSASLFESELSHNRLREVLRTTRRPLLTPSTLDEASYPADEAQLAQLDSEGFSLVEYLLSLGTPRDLLRVQQAAEPPSRSLVRVYRIETPQLLANWQTWQRQRLRVGTRCDCVNCPYHRSRPTNTTVPAKPVLTIWTAEWCEPCQRFHADLRDNSAFRKALESHYQLVERDFDQDRSFATQQGISTVPTFQTQAREIHGYLGSDWLLEQLGLKSLSTQEGEAPAEPLPKIEVTPPAENAATAPVVPPRIAPLVVPTGPSLLTLPPPAPLPTAAPSRSGAGGWMLDMAPKVISVLTSLGVLSGTAFTGGIGGVALMLAWRLLKRRATRVASGKTSQGGTSGSAAPFPRELDEAGELLGLRRSEGRVATLDTLRGMFLDDELSKLHDSPAPTAAAIAQKLRAAIDKRVDEVAPLTTKS
jgi:hypothetical protein